MTKKSGSSRGAHLFIIRYYLLPRSDLLENAQKFLWEIAPDKVVRDRHGICSRTVAELHDIYSNDGFYIELT